jgi:peptidoglycan/LPS O-acetylase OafA/YrhL
MQDAKRFRALDSFRGLFALSVVIYHMDIVGTFTDLAFFRHADLFVEFFFVLSGFVMAHAYGKKERVDFRRFVIARTFRLLPLHWLMLAVFIVLEVCKSIAYSKGISFNYEPFTGAAAPSEILPNALLLQSWTSLTDPLSFNYPSWSISVEYYMYMIFLAVLAVGLKQRVLVWAAIAALAFVALTSDVDILTPSALRGLSCFFAGALSYVLYRYISDKVSCSFKVLTCLELLSLLLVVLLLSFNFDSKVLLASLLFCLVVVVYAFDGGAVSKALDTRWFSLVGKVSYSVYLTHAAVWFCTLSGFIVMQKVFGIELAPMIDDKRYIDTGNLLLNNVLAVSVLLIVIGVSVVTYKYVEVWGQSIGSRIINRGSKFSAMPEIGRP